MTSVFLIVTFSCIAQSVTFDERLLVRYDNEYLQNLSQNSPETLELLNYSLDHAWYVEKGLEEKYSTIQELYFMDTEIGEKSKLTVKSVNFEDINIYNYYFEQGLNNRTFYKIGNSGIVIGFYSLSEMAEMYNEEKGLSNE
jgi:hypothetical protein